MARLAGLLLGCPCRAAARAAPGAWDPPPDDDWLFRWAVTLSPHDRMFCSGYNGLTFTLDRTSLDEESLKRAEDGGGPLPPDSGRWYWSCGSTTAWLAELFLSTSSRLEDIKYHNPVPRPGGPWSKVSGRQLLAMFEDRRENPRPILWRFRCPFPFDHSFIIEQLPGRGYRVYQSFQGVYSLHGWLCPWDDVETLFEGGDVAQPQAQDVQRRVLERLWLRADPQNQELLTLSYALISDLPYHARIFYAARHRFGRGRIIPTDEFFREFLHPLAWLMDKVLDNGQAIYTLDMSTVYAKLFGSHCSILPLGATMQWWVETLGPAALQLEGVWVWPIEPDLQRDAADVLGRQAALLQLAKAHEGGAAVGRLCQCCQVCRVFESKPPELETPLLRLPSEVAGM
eukprot:EG_transcript_9875